MKTTVFVSAVLAILLSVTVLSCTNADVQEYVSPKTPLITGRSPGVKVKLISANDSTKTYVLIYAQGDELMSGIKEFAIKYHVKCAHFNGIGDAGSAKFGWLDQSKKMFKLHQLHEFAEITSLVGDITTYKSYDVPFAK